MAVELSHFPWVRYLLPADAARFSQELEAALRLVDETGEDGGESFEAVDVLISRWQARANRQSTAPGLHAESA